MGFTRDVKLELGTILPASEHCRRAQLSGLLFGAGVFEILSGGHYGVRVSLALPALARHHADSNPRDYSALLDWGLRLAFLLALPAAAALWLLAVPLVATLYQYGHFTANDVMQTREALLGYRQRRTQQPPAPASR